MTQNVLTPRQTPQPASGWNLRAEILAISHRWPVPVFIFLLGCLIGYGLAYLIPTPYRAEVTLSVAYNADAIFRNPDDYKNWQMEQLNSLALAPDVLERTLALLRQEDPGWKETSIQDLQPMLEVAWRNTGAWRLTAEHPQPQRARQAVSAWATAFLETFEQVSAEADKLYDLDRELYTLDLTQTQARERLARLKAIRPALKTWQKQVAALAPERPLDTLQRWQLGALASEAAGLNPGWKALTDAFPPAEGLPADYTAWLEHAIIATDTEVAILNTQIADLDPQRGEVWKKFVQANESSRGLSSLVHVERGLGAAQEPIAIRPYSLMALVGGILALMAWVLLWLARLGSSRRKA